VPLPHKVLVWLIACGAAGGVARAAPVPPAPQLVAVASPEEAVLVRVIETSEFSPPSPDPAGIAYLPGSGRLLVSDSEVNEMSIFAGVNLYSVSIAGNLVGGANTLAFSDEPTGLAVNPVNGHLFVSDDDADRIFEVDPGHDGVHGTGDDTVTFIDTDDFGCTDAEGVAYDPARNELFIIDGFHRTVFRVSAGSNDVFDGIAPGGDDSVSQFDVGGHGLVDPEGITFSAGTGTLYIFDEKSDQIIETTTTGTLLRSVSVLQAGLNGGAGLDIGPASDAPGQWNMYVVKRGVDNDSNPNENDGRLFELSFSGLGAGGNLPPNVSAGPDVTIGIAGGAVLAGSASDDGLPIPPGSLTVGWSQLSGPGPVTFADASKAQTTAGFSQTGQYVLRLGAYDGEFTTVDDVAIAVVADGGSQVERRVLADSDDAEEETSGDVDLDSSDLELVTESTLQTVGMRFTNVTIPKGATIASASVQFKVDEPESGATTLTIRGQAADDAPTFTSATGNVSSRPTTAAGVTWVPAPWTVVGEAGPAQRTPDLSPVIQEVVDRPGWSSGNALVLLVTGTGERVAEAHDGDASGAPLLRVAYGGAPAGNQAPFVDAGPALLVGLDDGASLDGTVADDGLPDPPGAVSTTWSRVSGPGPVAFDDAGAVDTTATFVEIGTYVLRLTADDGELGADDDTTVTVTVPNEPPFVDAGPDQSIGSGEVAALDGTVTDDGLPDPPNDVTTLWSRVSGPGNAVFVDASAVDTTVSFTSSGLHVLRLTADDGAASTSDDVAIAVASANAPPTVQITTPSQDLTVGEGTPVALLATASDPEDGILSGAVTWASSLTGALGAGAGIVPVLAPGLHTITASVVDSGGLGGSDSVQVDVLPAGTVHLTATIYKVKGRIRVDLSWFGADGSTVTILRDGVPLTTTANDGAHTDETGQKGKANFTYQVCEPGGGDCSAVVTVHT
jgi:hypothetical protein